MKQPDEIGREDSDNDNLPHAEISEENELFADHPELAELDRLYQQALSAMEAVEEGVGQIAAATSGTEWNPEDEGSEGALNSREDSSTSNSNGSTPQTSMAFAPAEPKNRQGFSIPSVWNDAEKPVEPRRIVEAVLFVGGELLTTRRLSSLMQGDFDAAAIEAMIDELNAIYLEEARPYEIRLAAGGYRLALREEFEPIRHRVFGLGPREVRLSQEALEILSLVAYRQPISRHDIEQTASRSGVASVLNQLLRRQLVQLERQGNDRQDVKFRTTPRFLQVFGLADLDDLPQSDDLKFK